jgi:hypothetical protein
VILTTLDSQFESNEDTEFRQQVNNWYPTNNKIHETQSEYSTGSVAVGIDKKFGRVIPGYFILPEYFMYRCVIFPESTWQNDELCLSEKICKCFYAESLPWPIGGSNIHKLYNEIGFYTAWNVLPDHLKLFDRYQKQQLECSSCVALDHSCHTLADRTSFRLSWLVQKIFSSLYVIL